MEEAILGLVLLVSALGLFIKIASSQAKKESS